MPTNFVDTYLQAVQSFAQELEAMWKADTGQTWTVFGPEPLSIPDEVRHRGARALGELVNQRRDAITLLGQNVIKAVASNQGNSSDVIEVVSGIDKWLFDGVPSGLNDRSDSGHLQRVRRELGERIERLRWYRSLANPSASISSTSKTRRQPSWWIEDAIRVLRTAREPMSQTELARKVGTKSQNISRALKSGRHPDLMQEWLANQRQKR